MIWSKDMSQNKLKTAPNWKSNNSSLSGRILMIPILYCCKISQELI